MQDLLVRVEMSDFDTWLRIFREHQDERRLHGISDARIYRDVENPTAVLIHFRADSNARAVEWFRSDKFKELTRQATVTRFEPIGEEKQAIGLSTSLNLPPTGR